jgi:hypothetical protein
MHVGLREKRHALPRAMPHRAAQSDTSHTSRVCVSMLHRPSPSNASAPTQHVPDTVHTIAEQKQLSVYSHEARFFPSTDVLGTTKSPRSAPPMPSPPLAGPPGALRPPDDGPVPDESPAASSPPPTGSSRSGVWMMGGSVCRFRRGVDMVPARRTAQPSTCPRRTHPLCHPARPCKGSKGPQTPISTPTSKDTCCTCPRKPNARTLTGARVQVALLKERSRTIGAMVKVNPCGVLTLSTSCTSCVSS